MKTGTPDAALSSLPQRGGLTWLAGGHSRHLLFGVLRSARESHTRTPGFRARNFGLNVILEGRAHFTDDAGRPHGLAAPALFTRRPALPTTLIIRSAPRWHEAFIALDPVTYADLTNCALLAPETLVCRQLAPHLRHDMLDLLRRLAARESAVGDLLGRVVMFVQAAARAAAPLGSGGDVATALTDAAALLDRELRGSISLVQVAAQVGLGYELFRKAFRARFGVSPGRYRIDKRLQLARALLAEGPLKIEAIARTLGYPNAYAFSAQFRRHVGVSPRRHRQLCAAR